MDDARQILEWKRGNRTAAISLLLAAVEWQCPAGEAVKAWKALTPSQQARLESAINEGIGGAVKGWEE